MNRTCSPQWMKSTVFAAVVGLILAVSAPCQSTNQISLWALSAPMAKGSGPADTPAIQLYLPSSNKPTPGILICPSGSYLGLSMEVDGRQVAEWLNTLGIAAFVLKYRLAPTYRYPVALLDAQRALRYIRSNASIYNVIGNKIGRAGGFRALPGPGQILRAQPPYGEPLLAEAPGS